MQALLLLLKRLGKSNLSMRSRLRISIYLNREMCFIQFQIEVKIFPQ